VKPPPRSPSGRRPPPPAVPGPTATTEDAVA
jgi:hypothetical protein